MSRPSTPQSRGWRQRLPSFGSKSTAEAPPQAARSSSSRGRRAAGDEGYLTDVESSANLRAAPKLPANVPPVPQLPAHVKSKTETVSTIRPRHTTPDGDGYHTDAAPRSHRRTRTVDDIRPAVANGSDGRPPPPPPVPAVPALPAGRGVYPPCLSDTEDESPSNRGGKKSSVSGLAGRRNDRDKLLQRSLPYPLNAFDDDARKVEKYMYCAAYYSKSPYRSRTYRGPSFLETLRARNPRRALDVGSGYSYWLRDASASWNKTTFVGFDVFDLPHVAMTVEQRSRISYKQGNLLDTRLPFNPGEFDYIRVANMRMAIPDAKWPNVLLNLCSLLCDGGVIEILDDGWSSPLYRYNANMATFGMSYEELYEFAMRERGFVEKARHAEHFERLVERPLRAIPQMVPLARNPILVVNQDPKLDWRWRRTLFLAEQAVRHTLVPILVRTEADPQSTGARTRMSARDKEELFVQDVHDLVNMLKVTPNAHRYRPTHFNSLVYQRRTRTQ